MDAGGRLRPLEAGWVERVWKLDPQETLLVPIRALTLIQIHDLRELRLYAYVPEHGYKPLGALYFIGEKQELSRKRQARYLRIQDFFIEKELRGRGLGSQMLTLFLRLALAEGFRYISGELSRQDAIDGSVAHLIRFYERHGFEISPVSRRDVILATIRLEILAAARA